jgi:hypothetical protein
LNARINRRTSASVLPFTAALIIDVDAWLIEHPWPAILMSRTVSVAGSTSRKSTTSSPHNGLKPSTLCAGGTSSSPRFRGER